MNLEDIIYYPGAIDDPDDLQAGFKSIFGCSEAKEVKNIVYFFISKNEFPRLRGFSNILYIGQTTNSIFKRYFRLASMLSRGENSEFYKYIINNFGPIKVGYVNVDDPKKCEKNYFDKYFKEHLEYPPKSKVG